MSLDNIARKFISKFYSNSFKYSSKTCHKYCFWKKIKRNFIFFIFWPEGPSYTRGPASLARCLAKGARPASSSQRRARPAGRPVRPAALGPAGRSPPRPGRNLGLGRDSFLSRAPAWADLSPHRRRLIPTIHHHPTATSESRNDKTP
jgi:hypothetical protein